MKLIKWIKNKLHKEESYINLSDLEVKRQNLNIKHYDNGGFCVGAEVINLKTKQMGVIIKNYKTIIKVMDSDGNFTDDLCFYFKRTGRHYPQIKILLNKLKERENE